MNSTSDSKPHWEDHERTVRLLAESVWSAPCESALVAGIQCDGVIKIKANFWVLIEISLQRSLNKLRDDLGKLNLMRQTLMAQNIFAECYFITLGPVSPSLVDTAINTFVEVHTPESFATKFIGASQYLHERRRQTFGSAVSPETGLTDEAEYLPIMYTDADNRRYGVPEIAELVARGRKIILLGEFGTGKSRCVKEVFTALADKSQVFVPIALNLRESWGHRTLNMMIRGHAEALGLSDFADTLLRSLHRGNHPLLLDGFDELGSQSWTGDPTRLSELRTRSLAGVRDAVERCPNSGILITGREHYFNDDREMLKNLGMESSQALILRCPDEFTDSEARAYLLRNSEVDYLPAWMPRKPLICQLFSSIGQEALKLIDESASGEVEFFERIVDAVCRRETRINAAIDTDVTKKILLRIAQDSRANTSSMISLTEINEAFYAVTGYEPRDDASVLLQRLPYLGRVGYGSTDRTFIDNYAKDGLRGLAMSRSVMATDAATARLRWTQPLEEFGLRVLGAKLPPTNRAYLKYVRQCTTHGNHQAAADVIAADLLRDAQPYAELDFEGITIGDGTITSLNFVQRRVKKLNLDNVFIRNMVIDDSELADVWIDNCIIESLDGLSSIQSRPDLFGRNCEVAYSREGLTSASISQLEVTDAQKTLIAILRKLFFQPGSGRKEQALIRGTARYWDAEAADKVLRYMEHNGIVRIIPGREGAVYIPSRQHMARIAAIIEERKSSKDELWLLVT